MKLTDIRTVQITSYLLLTLVVTQALYTALYINEAKALLKLIWGLEVVLFTILAAFAGAAMIQAKNYQLGWSAIAFSAVLNVVQVSIGLTMFGPVFAAAGQVEALGPVAGAVVALSFMIYNTAKILLGFAALVFGMAKLSAGAKTLGGLTVLAGVIAMSTNIFLIVFGRDTFLPTAVGGGSGLLATLLLALCLTSIAREDAKDK